MKKAPSPKLAPMARVPRSSGRSGSPGRHPSTSHGASKGVFVQPTRRRLSLVNSEMKGFEADGLTDNVVAEEVRLNTRVGRGGVVSKYASKSKVGVVSANPHKVNQDSHVEIENFGGDPSQYYFCVMDGHGSEGHEVSDLLRRRLPVNICSDKFIRNEPRSALIRAFLKTNQEISKSGINVAFSGSTCVGVFIRGSTLFCANVGDSRAVIGRLTATGSGNIVCEAVPVSDDHKPDRPDEFQRIMQNNGRVEAFRTPDGSPIGPPRVWWRTHDAPGLAMSRSFGDQVAAQVGVIAEPEVLQRQLTVHDKFIVIASDGVWEFIDSSECIKMITPFWERGDPQGACEFLVEESNRRWRQEEEVIDDTTAIIVFLNVPE